MKTASTHKIGLCLSGGGSRAMAFHLGCLRALHQHDILNKITLISTVSGGSVIGAMYAYSSDSFEQFTARVTQQLEAGFQKKSWRDFFPPLSVTFPFKVDKLVSALDDRLYRGKRLSAETRAGIEIIINACELSTSTAFRFGNKVISNWVLGKASADSISVAEAVAISAAHPLFFSTMNKQFEFQQDGFKDKQEVFLTDGGVYENLGVTPLLAGRAAEYSYPHYDFEYIIACDAEHSRPLPREHVEKSFFGAKELLYKFDRCLSTLMLRIRSMSFKVLHDYEREKVIKGFVLACLSCEDKNIFTENDELVPYAKVADYPTDFRAMKKASIALLAKRGEQITASLIKRYLNNIH